MFNARSQCTHIGIKTHISTHFICVSTSYCIYWNEFTLILLIPIQHRHFNFPHHVCETPFYYTDKSGSLYKEPTSHYFPCLIPLADSTCQTASLQGHSPCPVPGCHHEWCLLEPSLSPDAHARTCDFPVLGILLISLQWSFPTSDWPSVSGKPNLWGRHGKRKKQNEELFSCLSHALWSCGSC